MLEDYPAGTKVYLEQRDFVRRELRVYEKGDKFVLDMSSCPVGSFLWQRCVQMLGVEDAKFLKEQLEAFISVNGG